MSDETRDTGGPAFPAFQPHETWNKDRERWDMKMLPVDGMTLRDFFAAKAMQALLSNPNVVAASSTRGWELVNCNMHGIALEAYTQADAMLAERKK